MIRPLKLVCSIFNIHCIINKFTVVLFNFWYYPAGWSKAWGSAAHAAARRDHFSAWPPACMLARSLAAVWISARIFPPTHSPKSEWSESPSPSEKSVSRCTHTSNSGRSVGWWTKKKLSATQNTPRWLSQPTTAHHTKKGKKVRRREHCCAVSEWVRNLLPPTAWCKRWSQICYLSHTRLNFIVSENEQLLSNL
jgi:hypothetical protein